MTDPVPTTTVYPRGHELSDEGDMQSRHPMYRYRWGTTIQRGERTALWCVATEQPEMMGDDEWKLHRLNAINRLISLELGGI